MSTGPLVYPTPLGSPLPPRHQRLQAWAHEYLVNLTHALRVLETEPAHLSRLERETLHSAFGAIRFDEKYNHDKLNTLRLAVLEAKRRAARMLISQVLTVKKDV